jgi:UTP--glucose-1-phosphate uridylyltransferase
MKLRKAVIPVAGLGTRFLTATKTVPKELLPIIDTPALQLIIDEAVGAGISHIVIVTGRKPASKHFDEALSWSKSCGARQTEVRNAPADRGNDRGGVRSAEKAAGLPRGSLRARFGRRRTLCRDVG